MFNVVLYVMMVVLVMICVLFGFVDLCVSLVFINMLLMMLKSTAAYTVVVVV